MGKSFSKLLELPFEVRLQIFEYVFDGLLLHITPRPGSYPYSRWTYLRCTRQTSGLNGHWIACCPYFQSPVSWYDNWRDFMPPNTALLSLLLSSRSLYEDTVGLLYSRALFDFHNLEDYLDFVRYAPRTAQRLKHIRTRHIDIACPLTRSVDGQLRTDKDRTFVEALQRMFLHTPGLKSLRLIIESTALWERKAQHHRSARWAQMIVDLAKSRRELDCCPQRPWTKSSSGGETINSIVRFWTAVLPETVVQSSPWPSYARMPNFVRPPRADESADLDKTLVWLMNVVIGIES